MSEDIEKIKQKRQEWETRTLKPAFDALRLKESPTKYYSPADTEGFDFLDKVGFPGQYPFTAGTYATLSKETPRRGGDGEGSALVRAQVAIPATALLMIPGTTTETSRSEEAGRDPILLLTCRLNADTILIIQQSGVMSVRWVWR